ncbi:hypothetical protein CTI12_AA573250 [Artemisia annua]|uniref:Uncharacterized protein n=1 Tax=Artemisia annua TaxID=35608 RepID=A0A2U1KRB1_ARTAN|nr:hypothetical protein CTI12_AA573250 [Artemisia annua]
MNEMWNKKRVIHPNICGGLLDSLKSFHVTLMSIVQDVDVDPSTTPWDPAKAYLFVHLGEKQVDPIKEIDWVTVETIIE